LSSKRPTLRSTRRTIQTVFLALFLYLVLRTAEPLDFRVPVNIFLRSSPFLAITAILSTRAVITLFVPALAVAVLTVAFGRVFCGWICPFGTTVDICDRFLARSRREKDATTDIQPRYHPIKYALLIGLVVSAVFGVGFAGWFDPICIATRTYGIALYPYANFALEKALDGSVRANLFPGFVSWLDQAAHQSVLSFKQPVYRAHVLFLLVFVGIALLGSVERRFWCRHLCPLGALLDVLSRIALLRRRVRDGCTNCLRCQRACKMSAITGKGEKTFRGECIECFTCNAVCPEGVSTFAFSKDKKQGARSACLTRRGFVWAMLGGLVAVPVSRVNFSRNQGLLRFIRPPGVADEEEFLAACIRCGECVKVCITAGLQPVLLEGGIEALWTPKLVPRVGYCEYSCTLCGRACPTGAIPNLSRDVKQDMVLGTAFFDRSRCIPWAENRNCAVCEEVCPTPTKSIVLRETGLNDEVTGKPLRRPYVRQDVCIGCGLCENKCPLPGQAAVIVGAVRYPDEGRKRLLRGRARSGQRRLGWRRGAGRGRMG